MKYRLLDILLCNKCQKEFKVKVYKLKKVEFDSNFKIPNPACNEYCGLKDVRIENDSGISKILDCLSCYSKEIIDGILFCPCGTTYPLYKTIPRLLPKDLIDPEYFLKYPEDLISKNSSKTSQLIRTKKTFDIEWTHFSYKDEIYGHTQQEEELDFIKRVRFKKKNFENKLLLDAGCGIGRLIENLDKFGIESVGVELSSGIDNACSESNLKKRIHFIQGNITDLPVKPEVFDLIYSKGVLHYTFDAKKTFKNLSKLLKKRGVISVTIYPRLPFLFNLLNKVARSLSLILPPKAIYYFSFVITPLFPMAWKLSGFPSRKISTEERAHMVFNWFSSEYQNFHSREEVIGWFEENGFSEIEAFASPMGVTGRRL